VTAPDRQPRSVYSVGEDPDPQVSLANERTALSWMRTALALVAAGVALATLVSFGEQPTLLLVIASVSSVAGAVLASWALVHWRAAERALRLGQPVPKPSALPWLTTGTVAVALLLGAFVAFEAIERAG
jgi:putative membrane protein